MLPQKNNNCDNKKASVYMTDASECRQSRKRQSCDFSYLKEKTLKFMDFQVKLWYNKA